MSAASRRAPLVTAVVVLSASLAFAGELVEIGEPFVIADSSSFDAYATDVAMFADGRAVIVWDENPLGPRDPSDVRGRILYADGTPATDIFAINDFRMGAQSNPSVAVSGHRLLVAWSGRSANDSSGVSGRIFESDGTPVGPAFLLHEATTADQERGVSVARDGDGFVATWVRTAGVDGVRLGPDGSVRGRFTQLVENPRQAAITGLPDGNLALLWSSSHLVPNGHSDAEAGVVDGSILSNTDEVLHHFVLNEGRPRLKYDFVTDGNERLSTATSASGEFSAVYDSSVSTYVDDDNYLRDGYNLGARIERFSSAGGTFGSYILPAQSAQGRSGGVAVTAGGNIVSAFNDVDLLDGSGVFLRAFDCNGDMAQPGMVRVNSEDAYIAGPVSIAVDEHGQALAVWTERSSDKQRFPVFGRRYRIEDACSLCGDADENGEVTAVDALRALRTSVGLENCTPQRCDTDGSGRIGSGDALRILRAAVAGGRTLRCSAARRAALALSASLDGYSYETRASAMPLSDGNQAVLAAIDRDATYTLASLSVDEQLHVGDPQTLSELPSERGIGVDINACTSPAGLAVALGDYDESSDPGLHTDLANVLAKPTAGDLVTVNSNLFGSQYGGDVACLADGRSAFAWISTCDAYQWPDGPSLRPDVCDEEPVDGIYLQIVDTDGNKNGPMRRVGDVAGWPSIAPAGGERLVVAAGGMIDIRSSDGESIDRIDGPNDTYVSDLVCVGSLCARAGDGGVLILNLDDVASRFTAILQDSFYIGNRFVSASQPRVACMSNGACLAAYLIEENNFDTHIIEYHGIYARPFDLATGAVGEAIHLQNTDGYSYDPQVASLGPRSFLVKVHGNDALLLHRVDLD